MRVNELLKRDHDRRAADAARFRNLDIEQCQLCHAEGPDMRSLTLECGYQVHEVVPEAIDMLGIDESADYYLRICKGCRGRFLGMLAEWRAACVAMRGRGGRDD